MLQPKKDPGFVKSSGDQRKTKLLIVDDDEQGLNVLELLLKDQGYDVRTAQNGAQALDKAHIDPPDLIVSDIMMPIMDGFTLCRQWKKDDQLKDIPFIFYTATYTDPRDKGIALKLGVKRFILKPLEPKLFLKVLEEIVEECQTLPSPVPSVLQHQEESAFFREYNDALVRRLENKALELESAYDAIEREMIDRKRAEEALRASEEKYRNFVENASEGIFQSTPTRRYLRVNPALARMHGFDSPQELVASVTDIAHQIYLHVEDYDSLCHKLEAGASVHSYELELRQKDDTRIWVSMAARAVQGPDGKLAYYEGTVVDITERKRLEAQLLQSQRMEAIAQLARGIAHDFNNYLSAIMGFSGMLRMKMDKDDPRLNYVNHISSASEKAAGLTQSLLAFSKKQAIELEPRKLNAIFGNIEGLLGRLLHEDMELVLNLPETETLVMADVAELHQVLLNLATRARQSMRASGRLTITVQRAELDAEFMRCHGLGEPGDYAVISVMDNGIGMDDATKEKIFEPFSGPGTGLALSTVYVIIKQHNGFIDVSSSPDDGTTFTIYLPAIKAKSFKNDSVPLETH